MPSFTVSGDEDAKDIPARRDGITVVAMQNHVSKRHTKAPTHGRRGFHRNSESNCETEASQLLPVWPKELRDRSFAGRRTLIAIIERELRKERRLGLASHRGYDIARHAKLAQLLRHEREALRAFAVSANETSR